MKRLVSALVSLCLIFCFCINVAAVDSAPTDSFTHVVLSNGQIKSVPMRPVYNATQTVGMRSLGITDDIGVICDIKTDESGNTYILTDSGLIISFDDDFKLKKIHTILDKDGSECELSGAQGIFVCGSELYIADTKNGRVLRCVEDIVLEEILLPESSLIPKDFEFKPIAIVKDSKDYLYVLSEGSYYGALLYEPNGTFAGFFGANTVKATVLTTISAIWDRLTQNDIKRAKVAKKLPYQFSDIYIDKNNFVYTTTGMNAEGSTGQIKMLSPGGSNILSGADSFNFGENDLVKRLKNTVTQNFIAVTSDQLGFIYALDATYGLIYIYDTESNLLCAFGGGRGQGRQKGVFADACGIAISGNRLMVADSLKNNITVFEQTDFGELLLSAQAKTLDAEYVEADPLWEQVLKKDCFNSLALTGLAKSSYMKKDYSAAAKYAKAANDAVTYSQAYKEIQNKFISNNFVWLFPLAIILLGGAVTLLIYSRKREMVIIKNKKLRLAFSSMVHPFASFGEIKHKKLGSVYIALAFTVLFFLSSAANVIWSDFRYTTFDPATYSSVYQFIGTVGLVVLWSVANWGISTLQQGNGKLKEVFTVTAYSVIPIIIYNIVSTPLTHIISSADSSLISGLKLIAYIFTGIMLCVGLMVIHDFSFPRFVFTAVVTVLFMILIVFIIFLGGILITQLMGFVRSIVLEIMQS